MLLLRLLLQVFPYLLGKAKPLKIIGNVHINQLLGLTVLDQIKLLMMGEMPPCLFIKDWN
jgi:hypothetical protein